MLGSKSSSEEDAHVFWIVSVPRVQIELGKMQGRCRGLTHYNNLVVMEIPKNLRTGTMDDLYSLSDDLIKIDSFVEAAAKKISRQLKDLVEDNKDKKHGGSNEKVALTVGNASLETYMRHFEWNTAKYKTTVSLREIAEAISHDLTQLDEELRTQQSEYLIIGHAIEAFERSKTGNLQVRDLSDLVKEKDFVESEHLTTLFVIIPKHSNSDWESTYERLNDFVVPGSSKQIAVEGEAVLRNIVLFKSVVDDVKSAIIKKKWVVREYIYNPAEKEEKSGKIEEQKDRRKQLQSDLTRWCKVNFSEAFSAWVHLKAIRTYVESVLRFALPREYVFFVLEPDMKKERQLRKVLDEMFDNLSSEHMKGDTGDIVIAGTQEKFYPYVFSEITLS